MSGGIDIGGLPEGVADMPPGPELARVLAGVDRNRLTGHERVLLMQAHQRLVSHYEAERAADMVAVHEAECEALGPDPDPEVAEDLAVMEIRAALSWTRRAAERHLELARDVTQTLPGVGEALARGSIDLPRARVICDQTMHLDPRARSDVVDVVLGEAAGSTTGQLRALVARLVITADPAGARARYEGGLEDRRVVSDPNVSGTANLHGLDLPAVETRKILRRLNRLAHALKRGGDSRTIDQLRADVFLDLLCGGTARQGAGPGVETSDSGAVDIEVPLSTLVGLDDRPGTIPGWGPVLAEISRRVVREQVKAKWRAFVTGPDGEIVWVGRLRRRPTPTQRDELEIRKPTCVFPGCRVPAADCDVDHHRDWALGGPTEPWNNGPLCRHDHVGKHHGWRLRQLRPGLYEWVSPLGHRYLVRSRRPP